MHATSYAARRKGLWICSFAAGLGLLATSLLPAGGNITRNATAAGGESCVNCHRVDPIFSHPVGFVPQKAIPSHMPLVDGRMACTTCHEDVTPAEHGSKAGLQTAMLRSPGPGPEFCLQCHTGSDKTNPRLHGAANIKAHLRWPNRNQTAAGMVGGIDTESSSCLSCHDGSIASNAAIHNGSAGEKQLANHPIGVTYPGGLSPQGAYFNPAGSLDQRIRLFDQTVGCGSCHSPYSPHEKLLVMPNVRSQLCVTCHRM